MKCALIDSLTAWYDIPAMDAFQETSISDENKTLDDVSCLYEDSISVSKSSLLIMAFAVRHKLSGVALEDKN